MSENIGVTIDMLDRWYIDLAIGYHTLAVEGNACLGNSYLGYSYYINVKPVHLIYWLVTY